RGGLGFTADQRGHAPGSANPDLREAGGFHRGRGIGPPGGRRGRPVRGGPNPAELPPAPGPVRVPGPGPHPPLALQETEVADAVAAAAAVGVNVLVQIGIDVPSSQWAARMAAEHDAVWATVALHPNEAPRLPGTALETALRQIDSLAALDVVR